MWAELSQKKHPKSSKIQQKKEQNKPKLTMGFLQKFTIGYTLPNKPANCPSDTKSCWGGTFRRSTPALDAGFPGLGGPAQKPVFDRNWALEQGKNGDFNDDFMIFQGFFMVIWWFQWWFHGEINPGEIEWDLLRYETPLHGFNGGINSPIHGRKMVI